MNMEFRKCCTFGIIQIAICYLILHLVYKFDHQCQKQLRNHKSKVSFWSSLYLFELNSQGPATSPMHTSPHFDIWQNSHINGTLSPTGWDRANYWSQHIHRLYQITPTLRGLCGSFWIDYTLKIIFWGPKQTERKNTSCHSAEWKGPDTSQTW